MSWIKEEDMRAIRQEADIVDILSHYLTLQKKGKNYVAVCPFHDDHDPSLSINTEKQIFKCFVCGAGGDVFGFVQKIENISFPQAVAKVAAMIGYPLQIQGNVAQEKEEKAPYNELMNSYIQYCIYELQSEDGFACINYLQKRGIHEDIRNRFQIGYAPSNSRTLHFFKAKNYSKKELMDTGLIMEGKDGLRAVFHERLMIPIHDEKGNPVGFTARRLVEDGSPKYINSSETEIYQKSNLIFNYHRAIHFARKNQRVILVEGAMDVLAFEKADIHESIACLGTAFTKVQLLLIKALKVNVIVCYDGDRAGKEATYKFCKAAMDQNIGLQVVKNLTEKDPDEIFEEAGAKGLMDLIQKTSSVSEFFLDYLMNRYDLENYEDKLSFVKEMQNCIEKTCTEFEKNTHYAKIKALTGFDLRLPQNTESKRTPQKNKKPYLFIQRPKDGRSQAERACLNMMLLSKQAASRFRDEIGFFKDEMFLKLSYYCYDLYRFHDKIDFDVLLAHIDEENIRNLLLDLINDPYRLNSFDEKYFDDSIQKIKICMIQDQIDKINQQIHQCHDMNRKVELAQKKKEWIIQKNDLLRKDG